MVKNTQANAETWISSAAETRTASKAIFKHPAITTATQLREAFTVFNGAFRGMLAQHAPAVSAATTSELVKTFAEYMKTIVVFVARNPNMVGDVNTVSKRTASLLAGGLRNLLHDARNERVNDIVGVPIANAVLDLVAVSWGSLILRTENVSTDNEGSVTFNMAATSGNPGLKFYPSIIWTTVVKIQEAYDTKSCDLGALATDIPLIGKMLAVTGTAMNSVAGSPQMCVPLVGACRFEGLPAGAYRRDRREFKLAQLNGYLTSPIAVSMRAMRAVLASALEMSIALGDVKREIIVSTSDKPKQTKYTVAAGTKYHDLMRFAALFKAHFTQAGLKDVTDAQMSLDSTILWKSCENWKSVDAFRADIVQISANPAAELEGRLRIHDVSPDELTVEGVTARPTKEIKSTNWTHFAKNMSQLHQAVQVIESNGDLADYLPNEAVKRLKDLNLEQVRKMYEYLRNACANSAAILLAARMSLAIRNCSVTKATVERR